jgi:hypothetical protein
MKMAGHNITAKAKLGSKLELSNGDFVVQFYPDYYGDKSETNKAWATSTPSLSFQMNVKREVADKLEQGASYTVTFTPEEASDGNAAS